MKQVIIRIHEAKVTELMDQFVGRIERVARLTEAYNFPDYGEQEKPEHWETVYPQGFVARRFNGEQLEAEIEVRHVPGKPGKRSDGYAYTNRWTDEYTGQPRVLDKHTRTSVYSPEQAERFLVKEIKSYEDAGWQVERLTESSDKGDTKRVGVVAVFRRKGEELQVLMGKREYEPEAGKWALPGGHIKEGEDLDTGARREIKEETGLELDGLKKLRTRPGNDGETVHIYGTLYTGTEKAEADDETAGVKWMNVDRLPEGLAWDNNELVPKLAKEMAVNESITFRETNHDELEQSGVVQHFGDNALGDFSHHGEPFLILLDDRPVGWFQLTGQNKLNAIEVKPEFQKQGIATEVLRQLYGGKKPSVSTPPTSAGKKLLHKFNEAYAGSNAAELNSNQSLPAKRVMVYRTMHQPWATEAAQNMRDKFGINVWVDGTVTTGWGVYVHAADGERGRRMFLSLLPLGGTPPGLTPGLGEAAPIDVRKFMLQNKPSFIFKHSTHQGEQVFLNTKNSSEAWPLPIGCVSTDPQGQWFIVSGNTGLGKPGHKWTWWETEFPNGRGGVNGPRFNSRYSAALQLWLNYKDVPKA